MQLDIPTLFYLTMYIEAILGLLLLLAWAQNMATRAIAWWGSAHLMRSLSVALFGWHGSVPDVVSLDLASALLFVSFGLTWTGARVFDGRKPLPGSLFAGATLWMLAGQASLLNTDAGHVFLSATIIGGFSWATAYEFWRGRHEVLVSRFPAMLLVFAEGALFMLRTPLNAILHPSSSEATHASAWLTVVSPEALLFTIAVAFVLLAVGKERMEQRHKTAALVDALTGLANRRSFQEDAERIARTQVSRGRPVAMFLIDLDHFKSINDRFGHATGDRVLQLFAQVADDRLRPSDLIGRIGGEEFAVLLSDAARDNAYLVAERIRAAFAVAGRMIDEQPLAATVSIGVAIIQESGQDIDTLLAQADRALYRAKERGRNRVELAAPEPDLNAAAAERAEPADVAALASARHDDAPAAAA